MVIPAKLVPEVPNREAGPWFDKLTMTPFLSR